VLSGVGPDITWDRKALKFEGGLRFVSNTKRTSYSLGGLTIDNGVESSKWYSRHIDRNFLIKDVMASSRYMAESIVPVSACCRRAAALCFVSTQTHRGKG